MEAIPACRAPFLGTPNWMVACKPYGTHTSAAAPHMQSDTASKFLKQNYLYFQHWHHWYDKAVSLQKQATALYRAALPDLRLFEKAQRKAERKLKKKEVVPIEYPHPDLLPTFSLFGSSLENIFKGLVVFKN